MAHPHISGPERVRRTVFFSDIRNFTEIAKTHSPETTFRMLARCLDLQGRRIRSHGGRPDTFVGDSVVAVFDRDGMAADAVRSAVDIQERLRSGTGGTVGEPELTVGIGIVTGELIVGSLGIENASEFTIIGPHVGLGSKLCNAAGPFQILIDADTSRRLGDLFEIRPAGTIACGGFDSPVPIYRIVGR